MCVRTYILCICALTKLYSVVYTTYIRIYVHKWDIHIRITPEYGTVCMYIQTFKLSLIPWYFPEEFKWNRNFLFLSSMSLRSWSFEGITPNISLWYMQMVCTYVHRLCNNLTVETYTYILTMFLWYDFASTHNFRCSKTSHIGTLCSYICM